MGEPLLYDEWCEKIIETLKDFGVEQERINTMMDFRNEVPLGDIYMNGGSYLGAMYALLRHEADTDESERG